MQNAGFVNAGFELVRDVFEDNFAIYGDIGAAFCVRLGGQVVVDLYSGWHDDKANPPIPWKQDSITNVYSCTKAMANMCVIKLIDEGYLQFNTPISSVWHDFGKNGKENITVEQLLTHQAGLNILEGKSVTGEDLIEWTNYLLGKSSSSDLYEILVSQKSLWAPNNKFFAYHPLSIGFYLSELVRRADPKRRSVQVFWRDVIATPFDIDFYIGLPQDFDSGRLARLVSTPTLEDGACAETSARAPVRPSSRLPLFSKSKVSSTQPDLPEDLSENLPQIIARSFTLVKRFSPWKTRFAELPSAIGFGNARALSKAFSLLVSAARGEKSPFGMFVSQNTAIQAVEKAIEGFDLTGQRHVVFSRAGYFMSEQYPGAFHHSGNGGALVWGDTTTGISLSYTPSNLLGSASHGHGTRSEKLVQAVYYCLSLQSTNKKTLSAKL